MWYTILITLVVDVGGLIVLYAVLRDRVRRATTAEAQIGEIRDEVSRLLVELNQTTDRNILLMEDRVAGLNELLAAADRKIGLLHREIEKHDVGSRIYSRLAQGRPATGPADGGTGAAEGAGAAETVTAGAAPGAEAAGSPAAHGGGRAASLPASRVPSPPAPAGRAARVPPPAPGPSPSTAGSPARRESIGEPTLAVELAERADRRQAPRREGPGRDPAEELQERVLMLHRAGFSASLIAGRVGAPVGEVELIIGLEERKLSGR